MNDQPRKKPGIPPLAGVCSYDSAIRTGFTVDETVALLKRYNFIKSRLVQVYAAHLPHTPEWEVKGAFSLHMWLDAEHGSLFRKRVAEMREPPIHMDKVPDPKLEALMGEVIRAESTVELLTGIYKVVKPELLAAIKRHLQTANPIADHPTYRMLKIVMHEEEEMIEWGSAAITALLDTDDNVRESGLWEEHLAAYLADACGISGTSAPSGQVSLPASRSRGEEYEMKVVPRRDERFADGFNRSGEIDKYYLDTSLEDKERSCALAYRRLREMDVTEYMAPMIYRVKERPWEYYADMSRQLWDEARHSMMGEATLYRDGIEFSKYPIDMKTAYILNRLFDPVEAHVFLFGIEQAGMPKTKGKRREWVIAQSSKDELMAIFQDYDWADEILHAQTGRKWLASVYGGLEPLLSAYGTIRERYDRHVEETAHLSEHRPWWPSFMEEVRRNRGRAQLRS